MDNLTDMTTYTVKPGGCAKVGGYLLIAFLVIGVVVGLWAWSYTTDVYETTFRNALPTTAAPDAATIKATSFPVSYDNLARYTEKYTGKTVHFHGDIVQVDERSSDSYLLRVLVDNGDAVIVHYQGRRVLVDDRVDLYALVNGRITYTTVLGASLTVPELTAQLLTVEQK